MHIMDETVIMKFWRQKNKYKEILLEQGPFLRIGRAHAFLGSKVHPYPLGEEALVPQHWPHSPLFHRQSYRLKHFHGEVSRPIQTQDSSSEPKTVAQRQRPSFPLPFFVRLGSSSPPWWAQEVLPLGLRPLRQGLYLLSCPFFIFYQLGQFVQGLEDLELEAWELLGPWELWSQCGILVRRVDLAISSLSSSFQALQQPLGPH